MRAIVGLDHPTRGQALVEGRRYVEHPAPLCAVGALLEAGAAHPGRSATTTSVPSPPPTGSAGDGWRR